MSRSEKLTCDCGCGMTVTSPHLCGWFTLSQLPPSHSGDDPKLKRELQFGTLECLATWSRKAASVLSGLQESARDLSPRGTIFNEKVPELYV